jgi:hypothetical protein
LIKSTKVFADFERNFNHFFEDCERAFKNELIISMFCRISTHNRTIISHRQHVKEMFFIRQGIVVVENSKEDSIIKNRPILYLPKFSYFGDYHILLNLKSNLVFRTIKDIPEEHKDPEQLNFDPEKLPTTYFMCIGK